MLHDLAHVLPFHSCCIQNFLPFIFWLISTSILPHKHNSQQRTFQFRLDKARYSALCALYSPYQGTNRVLWCFSNTVCLSIIAQCLTRHMAWGRFSWKFLSVDKGAYSLIIVLNVKLSPLCFECGDLFVYFESSMDKSALGQESNFNFVPFLAKYKQFNNWKYLLFKEYKSYTSLRKDYTFKCM